MARRKKKRRLGTITEGDVIEAGAAVERFCPQLFKAPQYIAVCKKTAGRFIEEVTKSGTTPGGIAKAANATEEFCLKNYKTGQYASVCKKMTGNMIRAVVKVEARREGRVIAPGRKTVIKHHRGPLPPEAYE